MGDYWDTNYPRELLNPVEAAEQDRIRTGALTPGEVGEQEQEARRRASGWGTGSHGRDVPAASFKDNLRAIGLIMLLVFVVYGSSGNRSQSVSETVDESSPSDYRPFERVSTSTPTASSTSSVEPAAKPMTFKPTRAAYAFLYSLGWFALATLSVHSNDPKQEDWLTIVKKSALAPFGILVFLGVVTFLVTFFSMFLGGAMLGWQDGFDPGIVFQILLVSGVTIAGLLVAGPFAVTAIDGYRPKTRWKFTLPAMGSIGLLMVVAVALIGTVRGLIWS